ncbi:DUF3397 domain-containing protein [Bacillus massiliigorillae]|uniref:DUF3397 domain-containing protein n=1 Tax=Bacillus massiliigorillae TaxID=1243664 RepID=UPI0003A27E07|nr:DUF3397 domain-containing protein [Bacillus massiliigorillae]
MEGLFSGFIATLVTFPFIGYIIVFVVTKQITKKHRKSMSVALNCSFILLISSVHFFILSIWQVSLLWAILMIVLLSAMLVVIVHHKVKEEIVIVNVLKGVLRINSFLFSIAYVLLVGYGLVANLINLL